MRAHVSYSQQLDQDCSPCSSHFDKHSKPHNIAQQRTWIGCWRICGTRGSEKLKDTVLYSYALLGTFQLEGFGQSVGSPNNVPFWGSA